MSDKVCTVCKNPVATHVGVHGKKCDKVSNPPLEASAMEDVKIEDKDITQASLTEMMRQMGELTAAMRLMNVNQLKMQSDLSEVGRKQQAVESSNVPVHHMVPVPAAVSQDTYTSLPTGARVKDKVVKGATQGEFVNLIDFIPNNEPSTSLESVFSNDQVIFREKKPKRGLDNYFQWSRAWAGYEFVLINFNVNLFETLMLYRMEIQEMDQCYQWAAVLSYDARHRHRKSIHKAMDFNKTDTEIYVSLLTSIKVGSPGCFRCQSLDHYQQDCPFYDERRGDARDRRAPKQNRRSEISQPVQKVGGTSSTQWNPQAAPFVSNNVNSRRSSQPCHKYNAGRCFEKNCERSHICAGMCGGKEPLPRCKKCFVPGSEV